MRKCVALVLTAGLMAVPAALASSSDGHDHGRPAHVEKVKMAMFEFSGTVAVVGNDTITVSPVRAHGKPSRVALAGAVTFTVKLGTQTRITRGGMGRATLADVVVGDRVKVEIRAPRGTTLADMPAATRVKLKPAELVTPAPVPVEPTPTVTAPPAPTSTQTAPPPPPMIGF